MRCRRCSLVRTERDDGPLEARYDESYYSAHSLADTMARLAGGRSPRSRLIDFAYSAYLDPSSPTWRRLVALPVRNRLGGLPPRQGSGMDLLDVGSGDGDFLRRALRSGYRAVGQEINAEAVASAQKAGVDVRLGELDEVAFPPASFDVVRLWHVLEHVPDPVRTLKTVHGLLRPNGLLVLGVPDFASPARRLFGVRWSGLQLPYHRHHFTHATLRATLEAGGFRLRSMRHRSVGTIFSSVTERRALPAPLAAASWASLLAVDDVLDLAGLGDTMEATAAPA
jgi:SAM-dependent methyltransferase